MRRLRSNSSRSAGTTGIVMKAMGLFGGMQMLSMLCGLVRIKVVALLLGTVGVGLFSVFNNALSMISTATQLGVRTSAVREVAVKPTPDVMATVRWWGMALGLFGVLVTVLSAPALSIWTFGSTSHMWHYVALAPAVLLMAVTVCEQAIMQGCNRLKALAKSSVWGVVGGLVLSLPLVWWLRMHCIVAVVTAYAFTSWVGVMMCRDGSSTRGKVVRQLGLPMLRLGGYMTVAAVVAELVNYVFISYLSKSGGVDTVGVYQSGYTIITRYVGMLFSALIVEYYPRLSACGANHRRQQVFIHHEVLLLTCMLTPVLVLLIILAPVVVRVLYSSEFMDIVPYIVAACPGLVLKGYSWCLSVQLLARGNGRLYMFTETASSLIGLALSIAGYSLCGMTGLGVAYTLWYASYALIMTVVNVRCYGGHMPRRVTLVTLGALALISAVSALFICI